ncbi:MAG: T9SS type A sorting domain-containing protein [Flavobacteriales bacterium]|nr:T9SS type A sorting domain-containing protein [Flavobacteriales bacterium]MCB9167839.1 T9SS type A sorting domain-containing protein [Flavobacteriales bacterium]
MRRLLLPIIGFVLGGSLHAQEDLAVMTAFRNAGSARPQVAIYEDPASTTIRIVTPEDAYLIELIDANGLLVSSGPIKGAQRLDLSDIPPGRYTVHVRTFSGSAYSPLVVPER